MRVLRSIALLSLALCGAAQAKSALQYEQEFESWMRAHHLTFADAVQYARSLENYILNDMFISSQNEEHDGVTFGHNAYSHLSFGEFKSQVMGLKLPASYMQQRLVNRKDNLLYDDSKVPDSVDWVAKGAVTPVKNQGMCGSCWAFSTTGAVEGATFVATGTLPNLSEQELVDCDDNGDMGCNGGLMDHAFQWIESHGLCSESNYSYVGHRTVCRTCQEVVKVTGFQDVNPQDEKALKIAVAQQPVSVAIEADQRAFQFYKSGVFNLTCGTQLDHGVLAVGYGVEDGQKFWKVKNSWGGSWGEEGYIRMSRGDKGPSGQCGIALAPSYPFAVLSQSKPEEATQSYVAVDKSTQTNLWSSAKISQCGDKTKAGILFDDLEISPLAPKRGKPVVFSGHGQFKEDLNTADFKLHVMLGGQQVFGHTGKLCGDTHIPLPLGLGHIDVHGFQCPVKSGGSSALKVDVNLPIIAPSGNYQIKLLSGDGNSEDSLMCVNVELDLDDDEEFKKSSVYDVLSVM